MSTPGIGDNGGPKMDDDTKGTKTGGVAADRLRSIIERIERLDEEKKALTTDIREIYLEGRSAGFDVKVIRQIIAMRRREPAEVEEQETLRAVYMRALGM